MMKKNPLSQTLWVCQLPRRRELLWSGTVKCIKPRPLGEVASRSDDGEGFPSEDDEKCIMRSEREKITGKVAAATLRLNIGRYELPPDEDTCYLLLGS